MCGCEFHAGLGEDVVDKIDTLRCGQEWAVLGVLVEVSDEGVEAGEGDADALGRDPPWSVVYVGVSVKKYRWMDDVIDGDVIRPQDGDVPVVWILLDGQ